MSFFNRFKEHEIGIGNIVNPLDGEYKLRAFKGFEFPRGSGRVWEYPNTGRTLMDWTPNLVTNQGLNNRGNEGINLLQYCHVGGGNTTPQITDTSLASEIATAWRTGYTPSGRGTPPYYGTTELRYLFNPNFGGGNVNINEIGVSPNGSPTGLESRALTVDGDGVPTTVSVLADEYLEAYYRLRNYPAHLNSDGSPTDDQGTVNIAGTNYTYTIRPIMVTYGGSYSVGTGVGWGTFAIYSQRVSVGYNYNIYAVADVFEDDMALGPVTGVPTGTKPSSTSASNYGESAYTSGSYNRELWYQWGISNGNPSSTGIGGLVIKSRLGAYQLLFASPVPKVYGQVFTFYHNFSWTRKSI
jgi:hypothetical protein